MMNNISISLQEKIDHKTKPIGSLGILESIALQIGTIQNTLNPKITLPTILVFAADHGIAHEKVSAYPAEVTSQMVYNFLNGGAAINIFCLENNINLKIIDAGVNNDFSEHPNLIISKSRKGTENILKGPAMSDYDFKFAWRSGEEITQKIINQGSNIIGFGEMGIGNTSCATLIMSELLSIPLEDCVGRGTGLNDTALEAKLNTLKMVQLNMPKSRNATDILRNYGGFEIVQIAAGMIQAYQNKVTILVDGFITTAAYAIAFSLQPNIINYAIFCHQSDEQAHELFLKKLGVQSLLNLQLRLGEGTGCALAFPIIKAAVAFLNNMSSFEEAGVSQKMSYD